MLETFTPASDLGMFKMTEIGKLLVILGLALVVVFPQEPQNQGQQYAQDEAGDNRKVEADSLTKL